MTRTISHSTLRRRLNLGHLGDRIERRRAELGVLVIALLVFLTYISIVAINGIPFAHTLALRAVLPPTGPILARGDEVLIAGQPVGQIRAVTPTANGRLATFTIAVGERIGQDASAIVRLRGLAGATYLQLNPGSPAHPVRAGFTIPLRQTSTNTQLTDVIASFDQATRAQMSTTLRSYGDPIGLEGPQVNQALAALPGMLRLTTPVLRAFDPAPGQLSGMLHEADRTVIGLAGQRPGDFGAMLAATPPALDALASPSAKLGESIDRLRPFSDQAQAVLPIADPVLSNASAAARALDPAVSALEQALPSLRSLVRQAPTLAQLSRLAHALTPTLDAARPALVDLWPAAASLAPLTDGIYPLAAWAAQYPQELVGGPEGFVKWGGFTYADGVASGAKAVRFAPVFTCSPGRDPYPAPGQAIKDHKQCPGT